MSEKDVSSTDTSFESSVDVGKQVNDNLQTWPRTQLGAVGKVRKEFNECLENENLLNRAKAFLLSADEGGNHQALRSTIESLCQLIDEGNRLKAAKMRAQTNGMLDAKSAGGSRRPSISAQRRNSGGTRPKQQQMQSMILCKIPSKTGAPAPKRKSSVGGPTPAILQGLQKVPEEEERDEQQKEGGMEAGGEDADAAQQPKPVAAIEAAADEPVSMPWILRVLPNVSIVLSALLYLIVGAIMFRWLDDEMAKKPFRWAVILAFETCTTIGWGDSKPTNRWSQAFCTLYTIFGVPIVFCAFANVGRLISPYYTIDWLLLTGVVRKKAHGSQHRLPMKRALNFLFLHQFVGTLLYSGLFKDLPVITAIYFSVTSMGTIGIGDYHPDTESGAEAVVALLYIGIGIILLSALLLSINFYYQTFFFIWLRDKLHDCWSAKMIEKKVHSYPKSNLA